MILSLVLTVVDLFLLKPLLTLYGANTENMGYALEYSTVIVSGAFFFLLAQTTNSLLKGMGYAKRAFINLLLSIIVNTILDPIFIFVFKWGVLGAALSTVVGNVVSAILAIQFLCSKKSAAHIKLVNMKLEASTIKTIISIGTPACVTQIGLSLISLTYNHVANNIGGSGAVAAYGIIYSVIMLVYMPVLGLGQGIQPIFGYNYGSKNFERVKQILKHSITYATVFCIIMFAIIEIFSGTITTLLGGKSDPELIAMATNGLRLFSLSLPVVGFQMIGTNYFQYVGKFKNSVILSVLRQFILPIPLIFILANFLGLTGIWIAAPIADFISFIVTALFIKNEICRINQGELLKGVS